MHILIVRMKRKKNVLTELFGALPFSKPTKELLKRHRDRMESKMIKKE